MSSGLEIERKYLIFMPNVADLKCMPQCEIWDIVQTYLGNYAHGETRRVRSIFANETWKYVYTHKRRISAISCREDERELSLAEYRALLKEADPDCRPIEKQRLRIPYLGQTLEVDLYSFWNDRATLEVEIQSEDQAVQLPAWVRLVRDVSDDRAYTNHQLAKKIPMEILDSED